jgi:curved DNA-binding protein CbpA
MTDEGVLDYYEVLQVSANAEQDTIQRVYRLLAQRFHPDNKDTGSDARFREIHEAYTVLSDPEKRARYDINYQQRRNERWRLVASAAESESDFETEMIVRLTLLEALYTRRRVEPQSPAIYSTELESLLGRPREHLEFTVWYLIARKYLTRDDQSRLQITADGVDYLEQNYRSNLQRRRLTGSTEKS